jgi:hypothetical protein
LRPDRHPAQLAPGVLGRIVERRSLRGPQACRAVFRMSVDYRLRASSGGLSDLNTWGWVVLTIGAVRVLAGIGTWAGNQVARWAGILMAGLSAIAQLLPCRAIRSRRWPSLPSTS